MNKHPLSNEQQAIPHPANIEIPMDGNTFLSKHDMDMHFTYCDDRVKELINYTSEELIGKSLYDYHHALDSEVVEKAYKDCTRVEHKDLVLSQVQLPSTKCLPCNIQMRTESLFTRKTDDMDQGYFIPPEMRDTINFVNNEPEDLSYLAPTAGDGSVPLSFPLFSQVAMANHEDDRTLSSPPALLMVGLKKEPCVSPPICRSRSKDNISSGNPSPASTSNASSRINSPHDYMTSANPDMVMSMDKFFQAMDTKADGSSEKDVEQSFGKTESVFKPKSELFGEVPQPPKQSVRDMISGSTAVASIEQPPDTMFQQIKRPLDMNSLEKGPPAHKRRTPDNMLRSQLLRLTQRDCEVNAPASTTALLQGAELIRALEIDLQQMQQAPR
nr:hypothetical protein BaRGS_035083 [Batillaria attramentaria]